MTDELTSHEAFAPAEDMTRQEIQAEREWLSRQIDGLNGLRLEILRLQELRSRRSSLAFELVRRSLLPVGEGRRGARRSAGALS